MLSRGIQSRVTPSRRLVRAALIAATLCGSACSLVGPQVVEESAKPPVETPPPSIPEVAAKPSPEQDARTEAPPPPTPPPPDRVLVLMSSGAASYAEVGAALGTKLGKRYELHRITLPEHSDEASHPTIEQTNWQAVVAVGRDAADLAAAELHTPIVFCQIFDYEPLLEQRASIFGVEALPPIALQLKAWKELAPGVGSVGLIVSHTTAPMIEQARQAAADAGLALRVEHAETDRELLYRFKRLAPSVDGILLLPDNTILSPSTVREILAYAETHHVHSIVFNRALLNWGALLSVSNDPEDVATKVAEVIDAIVNGKTADLARVTPLSAARTYFNPKVAKALGLAPLAHNPELAAEIP